MTSILPVDTDWTVDIYNKLSNLDGTQEFKKKFEDAMATEKKRKKINLPIYKLYLWGKTPKQVTWCEIFLDDDLFPGKFREYNLPVDLTYYIP